MNIKKALVVDDSKVAHLTLRKLLLERGIEVDWVGSGEDCVKYLDTKRPDIVFMDVMMPGMDGFETTRAITGLQPEDAAPIIMCSANATEEDKRDARESGAVGFLSKPYTPAQLDEILRMVSEGTAAITLEEPISLAPVIPTPVVVEKAPAPAAPAPEVPLPVPAAGSPAVGEIEPLVERVAWAAAEKVARDIIQELVPNLAREVAVQAARGVAEDLGRRAAHAAGGAAKEAPKQVATKTSRGTAEKTARTTAQESARAVAEQAAREVSEGVSQRNIARGLEVNRDELLQQIEVQIDQKSRESFVFATSTPEFRQQILQMVRSGIQPVIETISRETAERSIQQAAANSSAQGGPAESRANLALVVGIVALLGAAAALLGYVFKLF